ncbi:MAG: CinA family nicotinamide mononucleotide deamidase-related protein [Candidatus Krumholzibacteria bacterium]|nr:CinA family nicotinamide mononucleotide deamidase-related protein [Candidatus Krumholzibacteria bacterium]
MNVELLIVGTEVLRGRTEESNEVWLARALDAAGLCVRRITVIGDDREQIAAQLGAAAGRAGAVIVTGGLGPTVDDVTREAAIDAFGGESDLRPEIVREIERRFEQFGFPMPEGYRALGRIPSGAQVIENRIGAAPGLRIVRGGCRLFLLPGVPAEMREIFTRAVLPALVPDGSLAGEVLRIFGIGETGVEERLVEVFGTPLPAGLSIISGPSGVGVYLPAGVAPEAVGRLRAVLGPDLFGGGNDRLEEVALRLLRQRGASLATAESVTGGLVASMLVSVPGASESLLEGYVTYSNESKTRLLGVGAAILEEFGAVSAEVCGLMAEGALRASGADYAVSTTGIAGPGGASEGKPAGLCFVGLASRAGTRRRELRSAGERETIRFRTACAAIDLLRRELAGSGEEGR